MRTRREPVRQWLNRRDEIRTTINTTAPDSDVTLSLAVCFRLGICDNNKRRLLRDEIVSDSGIIATDATPSIGRCQMSNLEASNVLYGGGFAIGMIELQVETNWLTRRRITSDNNVEELLCNMKPSVNQCNQQTVDNSVFSSLTSSLRFSHRPHGLSSRISLSSSESSPLSLGDLCSESLLLDLLPGMAMAAQLNTTLIFGSSYWSLSLN